MIENMMLFTLHEDEKKLSIEGAVLARSSQEAASVLGGEFVKVEGWPPDSSTNIDDLSLVGKVRFAPELFRGYSRETISQVGHVPPPLYSKQGLRLFEKEGAMGRTLVLRMSPVVLPDYIIPSE